MPYRRLPNTDSARVRALKTIVEQGDQATDVLALPYSLHMLSKARNFLRHFEAAHRNYKACYDEQSRASSTHHEKAKNARLYVSHFVQVMNLAILRGEIPREAKELYNLSPDNFNLPDLASDASLFEWGRKIIDGEQARISQGGAPIYTPTIAKVRVFYDTFRESYERQKNFQRLTNKSLDDISALRPEADEMLLDFWNGIEEKYMDVEPMEARLDACRQFGVVYYYRSSEKRRMAMQKNEAQLGLFDDLDNE